MGCLGYISAAEVDGTTQSSLPSAREGRTVIRLMAHIVVKRCVATATTRREMYDSAMTNKQCKTCREILPLSDFYTSSSKGSKYKYGSCKICTNKQVRKKYDPLKRKSYHLKRLYGITLEDYEEKLARQDNGCAICGAKIPGGNGTHFYVDHNHTTGQIRDLLCHNCNFVIGYAKEDTDILKAVINYLEIWGDES